MISIFKNINRYARNWKFLDAVAIFFARFVPYLMVAFLFFYSVYISNIYLFIVPIFSGFISRYAINEFVHLFYKSKRPALLENTKVLIPVPKNSSFPSGHSSFFFGISFLLVFYNIYFGLIFILLSFLIGTARVFCGVHWFRDILGGIVAGFLSAIIIHYLLTIIK